MAQMIYWGLFFEPEMMLATLEKKIEHPHITFGYKTQPPAHFFEVLGYWDAVEIIGYGRNKDNEGYEVCLFPHQVKMYSGAHNPHITTSISKHGRAINTADVRFHPTVKMVLHGRWGWFGSDGKVHFEAIKKS